MKAHSFFFFGGLSIHLSQALLAHLFSYNIMWTATKKEVERSNFFIEVPRILRRFWLAFVAGFLVWDDSCLRERSSSSRMADSRIVLGRDLAARRRSRESYPLPHRAQSLVDDFLVLISLHLLCTSPSLYHYRCVTTVYMPRTRLETDSRHFPYPTFCLLKKRHIHDAIFITVNIYLSFNF
jgi:hypothetical protein